MRRFFLLLATLAVASTDPLHSQKFKSCIDHCDCKSNDSHTLQVVGCDRQLILNETTFRNVNKQIISTISFENVFIYQIQESVFKGFKILEDVLIIDSDIGSIDAKAFNHIKRLKFENCGFEDSPDLFSEKLEELHFGSCQIEEIPQLGDLLSLTFLNLTGNYIKDIDIETFAELFDLEELYLSNNEIFKLPATLFINNQELNSLYLDNNPLKEFYLNTSENLETLSLSNCHLENFDEVSTQRLSTLSELNLSNNRIKTLTGKAMSHMKGLFVINLANNQLDHLDDDIFSENPDLRTIILDGNNFTTLPNFFLKSGEVFTAYTFSCNHCGLKTLSNKVFRNMPGIVNLLLSHNEFLDIDYMFQTVPSVKILDVSYNKINYIAQLTFTNNVNLETLNIAGNPLISINPEIFAHNRVIREIDARNCTLTMLWSNKNGMIPSLNKLLLSNNNITSLSVDDLNVVPNLVSIDLNNNSFEFSTDFCNVINWMDAKKIRPIGNTQNLDSSLEGHYIEYPNPLGDSKFISWREFYKNKCPEKDADDYSVDDASQLDDSSRLLDDDDDDEYNYDDQTEGTNDYALNILDDDSDVIGRYYLDKNYDIDEKDANHSMNTDEDTKFVDESERTYYRDRMSRDNTLTRASNILSITSVFILTALVVLTVAVTITLTILRRNSNFNMHKANLPRLKIPLWQSTPGQKKHSGSVYRPLSEDLSGPKTPKLSRYDFSATPTVHSSNP